MGICASKRAKAAGGLESLMRRNGHMHRAECVDASLMSEAVITLMVPTPRLFSQTPGKEFTIYDADDGIELYRATLDATATCIFFSRVGDTERLCMLQQKSGGETYTLYTYYPNQDRQTSSGSDTGGAKIYRFAQISRDPSAKLPQHSFRYQLFDGNTELRPKLLGELVWPGSTLGRELGLPIGLPTFGAGWPGLQLVVRDAVNFGAGPILAAADEPDEQAMDKLPDKGAPAFALSMAAGMDALGLVAFAVAVEQLSG